jgi:undecaprenyl-diphosphatase
MTRLAALITTPVRLVVAALVAFAVVLGCAVAAGELLALVQRPDGSTGVDQTITTWAVTHRTGGLTTFAHALSTVGSQAVLIPLVALVMVGLLWRRRIFAAGWLVLTWGGAVGLYTLTKHFVARMRPPADIWLTDVGRSTSFPSGHATQSLATFVALALALAVWWPRAARPLRVIAVALAVGVGWSRVYLGVHWATDVVAGWLLAAAWVLVASRLSDRARALTPRSGHPPQNSAPTPRPTTEDDPPTPP